MKTIITTLNAKYIHTSLALRWLYVASKDVHDIDFIEYTIKDDLNEVAKKLLQTEAKVLGFGVYIWNVVETKKLIDIIKKENSNITIVLGGPEVGYETKYFIEAWDVDYVVSGESEFVFCELLTALKQNVPLNSIHVATKDKPSASPAIASIDRLELLESPYQLTRDINSQKNRVIYFETSRGCPYFCQYCLSSLEKGVRYFSKEYVSKQLAYLFSNSVHTIKFLDRTFNLKNEHTHFVFDTILKLYNTYTVCQFEIYADLLREDILDKLATFPKDFLRFEIGIQSTYELTNLEVQRIQNFDKIKTNVNRLHSDGVVDLHLDLIAGLPFETLNRFKQSFNDVFELKAVELQLGFLKMLRGTKLRKQAEVYGYLYDLEGPYEIYQHNDLSYEDIENIKLVEHTLERYWNSQYFKKTLAIIFSSSINYFEWFHQLALHEIDTDVNQLRHQVKDLFVSLQNFITLDDTLRETMLIDYYSHHKIKPSRFYFYEIDKIEKKRIQRILLADASWCEKYNINEKIMYKYSIIEKINSSRILLISYEHNICKINTYELKL